MIQRVTALARVRLANEYVDPIATANSLLYEGATPVFCDIDPVTLNIDPDAAAAAVGDATAGILPVHIFGYPADLPALSDLASREGLEILEDAAQTGRAARLGPRGMSRSSPSTPTSR